MHETVPNRQLICFMKFADYVFLITCDCKITLKNIIIVFRNNNC